MRIQAVGERWYYEDGIYSDGEWSIVESGKVWYASVNGVHFAKPFKTLEDAEKFAEKTPIPWTYENGRYYKQGWRVIYTVDGWAITTKDMITLPKRYSDPCEAVEFADKLMKNIHELDLILNHKNGIMN